MFVSKTSCRLYSLLLLENKPIITSCSDVLNKIANNRKFHTSSPVDANVSYKLSDIGEGIRDVTIKEWYVKVGDRISQFDKMCEVQSDKASVTITSRYDGVITKIYHEIDSVALVGQPLVDIEIDDEENVEKQQEKEEEKVKESEPIKDDTINNASEQNISSSKSAICIPSVRRLAKENNIDLTSIKGTGKDGRILKEDVLKYLQQNETQTKEPITRITEIKGDRKEPLRGFQKAMMKTMTEALKIPHFVYSDELDITKLSQLRQEIKQNSDENSVKISFMPFFIKAVSNALKRYSIINSSLDDNCENIIYKSSHNIGVAMDTAVGLAVPVIKNVQNLDIVQIAKELNRLMASGKQGNFATEDLNDGTFSISNIGIIGGTYTHPVILPPQVGIIAIGKSKVVPKFDSNNVVVPKEIVCLSASADHRIIDGVTMANFVQDVKKQIEHPYLLFLNL